MTEIVLEGANEGLSLFILLGRWVRGATAARHARNRTEDVQLSVQHQHVFYVIPARVAAAREESRVFAGSTPRRAQPQRNCYTADAVPGFFTRQTRARMTDHAPRFAVWASILAHVVS